MRAYLIVFAMLGITGGLIFFTVLFLSDRGMPYGSYRAWVSVLLSFLSLITNAAVGYYFGRHSQSREQRSGRRPQGKETT